MDQDLAQVVPLHMQPERRVRPGKALGEAFVTICRLVILAGASRGSCGFLVYGARDSRSDAAFSMSASDTST